MYFHFPCRNKCCVWEVVLQQFSVLRVAFLLWLVEIMSWSSFSMTFTLFPGPFKYKSPWLNCWERKIDSIKLLGERGRIPCICCFSCVASGCKAGSCWLGSLVVDLLSSSFLQSLFSLTISWWKQSQTCRTCSRQKVFCYLPCPFTAFIILSSLI